MFQNRVKLPPSVAQRVRLLTREKPLAFDQAQVAVPVEVEADSLTEASLTETASHVSNRQDTSENGPSDAVDAPPQYRASDERVWLVATRNALVVVPDANVEQAERIWWHEVDRAAWNPEQDLVKVSFTTTRPQTFWVVQAKTARKVLAVLRERVESTVVISETIALTSAENVRVAVRRDQHGSLFVEALCDPGVDPTHSEVIKRVQPVVEKLREVSGAA